jgi:hypothetical protein
VAWTQKPWFVLVAAYSVDRICRWVSSSSSSLVRQIAPSPFWTFQPIFWCNLSLTQPATHSRTWWGGEEIRADPPTSLWWQISPGSRMLLIWIPNKGWVCHTLALPIYIKKYLKAKKRRIMETQIYFTMQKYINLQNNPLNKKQNPSRYSYDSIITNLKFQHKQKISCLKNPHIKMDLLLPMGQNPLSYDIFYNESKHDISLPW